MQIADKDPDKGRQPIQTPPGSPPQLQPLQARPNSYLDAASFTATAQLTGSLTKNQAKSLYLERVAAQRCVHHADHADHAHAHHEKAPSILTALASAIINFLLMFGLCCAYGMIMFEDEWNAQHRGLAVKMNLSTALAIGLLLAFLSKVPVAIGGPDLNPVVFLGMFTGKIAENLASQHNLDYPSKDGRRLLDGSFLNVEAADIIRRLGGGGGADVEFCTGSHLKYHLDDCNSYHAELRATTIFTVALSSAILGFLFYCLGKFHMTRLVSYVPTNIMEAFLSCVGYKVFKYALAFCDYEPKQFMPAACIGVPLYFVKALHLGNPAIVIPLMLLVPLGVFYVLLYLTGGSVESARKDGWFFGEIENADFWSVWSYGFNVGSGESGGFLGNINFSAWSATLGDLPIMVVVCLLDCLLKISSTESKLPVKADKDYEIQLYGLGNILTTLCGSPVGYMQLKFNVINFGVMGNCSDRRGGVLYALFCGACFFYKTDLFNYLPKFFLSTLLFFAGSGFVAENLWGSRKYLSIGEWLQIFIVLAVFIFANSLLAAVIVGGLLAGASFIMRYAKIPCIHGHPLRGDEVVPVERKSSLVQCSIRHMSKQCLLAVRLKGFVFFASAQKLTSWVTRQVESQSEQRVPEYKRIHWIIFDCERLDGLDSSASKAIAKLAVAIKALNVELIWSGMSADVFSKLKSCAIITEDSGWFNSLDEAVQYTDSIIAERIIQIQKRWESLHPVFQMTHRLSCEKDSSDPFSAILPEDEHRFGCPWQYCGRLDIKAYETLLWTPGMKSGQLFLVHSGRVAVYPQIPAERDPTSVWPRPDAIYTHGWFFNRQSLLDKPTRGYAIALEDGQLLFWNEYQWSRMSREHPHMSEAIMKMVLRQETEDASLLERDKWSQKVLTAGDSQGSEEFVTEDEIKVCKCGEGQNEQDLGLQEIQCLVQRLSTAQALEKFGLFKPVQAQDESPFPQLPLQLSEDIRIAFETFARLDDADVEDQSIPAVDLERVLRYAGIYNIALRPIRKVSLTRPEFASLSMLSLLAPISNPMAANLRAVFRQSRDGYADINGESQPLTVMGRWRLRSFLNKTFDSNISSSQVDGIANVCGDPLSSVIDESSFVAVVSRLVRTHTHDLHLLKGICEVMGQKTVKDGDQVTKDMLMQANVNLTNEEAEEMIWVADFGLGQSTSTSIDYRLVVGMLNLVMESPRALPPAPKLNSSEAKQPPMSPVQNLPSDWIRNAILDISMPDVRPLNALLEDRPAAPSTLEPLFTEDAKVEIEIPNTFAAKVLLLLDYPESSRAANLLSVFMGMMILVSILTLFLEPLISPKNKVVSDTEKQVWYYLELFFTAVFTIEFLATFSVCDALGTQTHLQFLKEPMRVCDIVAVLPFYIDQSVDSDQEEFRLFRIARLMRLSRLVRLGRLAKRSATFAPIAMILVVIWGIYMKNGLKE